MDLPFLPFQPTLVCNDGTTGYLKYLRNYAHFYGITISGSQLVTGGIVNFDDCCVQLCLLGIE